MNAMPPSVQFVSADEMLRRAAAAEMVGAAPDKIPVSCLLHIDEAGKRAFPTVFSIGDFLKQTPRFAAWLVHDLLPAGGTSLVVAKPKVGKSVLSRDCAFCIARGEMFLGRKTRQGRVLLLAFEDHPDKLREQLAAMGLRTDDLIFVHVGVKPQGVDGYTWLRALIAFYKPAVVIVDPLFKLIAIKDGNDYAEMSAKLEPINTIARESGAHVMCVHHAGKGERAGGESVLGSTAIFAAVDTGIFITRTGGDRFVQVELRYGIEMEKTALDYNRKTGLIGIGSTQKAIRVGPIVDLVVDAVGSGAKTNLDIRKAIGGNQALVQQAITEAKAAGRIVIGSGTGKRNSPLRYILSPDSCFSFKDEAGIEAGIESETNEDPRERGKS